MTSGRRRSHADDVLSALQSRDDRERFAASRALLKSHLVHTREVPNGRDFLFSGPAEELHDALRVLRELETRCTRFMEFDYARIEDVFLLRIVAHPRYLGTIETYFD
jgi:hypothetical protein